MNYTELFDSDLQGSASRLQEFSQMYGQIHGYIAAMVCLWGIMANIVNIVVLTRKPMISPTNTILTWLAVADLLTMSSYFPVSLHFYIMRDNNLVFPETRSFHWCRFMLFHINFTVLSHTIAIWLTIVLAIFRYLFICYPTRGMTLCSMFRAKVAIVAVYISTVMICIPNYMATKMVNISTKSPSLSFNVTFDILLNSSDYSYFLSKSMESSNAPYTVENTKWSLEPTIMLINDINFWVQAILIKLIPCALLTILTILLIHAMHKANRRRMKLKSQGKKDESDRAREHNRTTAMLLAVVGLFLLTELPQGILTLCNTFIKDFFTDIYWHLGDLLDIMALLNNSINFILYCSMSRQFREQFIQVFCGCCPQRPDWMKVKVTTSASSTHYASVNSSEV